MNKLDEIALRIEARASERLGLSPLSSACKELWQQSISPTPFSLSPTRSNRLYPCAQYDYVRRRERGLSPMKRLQTQLDEEVKAAKINSDCKR